MSIIIGSKADSTAQGYVLSAAKWYLCMTTCLLFSTSRSSSLISCMYGFRGNPGALRPTKKSSPVLT